MINVADVQMLFVDLQPELTSGCKTILPQALAANAAVLANVGQLVDVPITFSVVPVQGAPGQLIAELAPYSNSGNTFPRVVAGPFMDPALASRLAAHERKTLIVSGFTAEVAVTQAALGALSADYTVFVPVDAIGSRSVRTESAALRMMERAGAIPASVQTLAAFLAPDFSRPPGSDVLATFVRLCPSE
ncbi:isochorismatase family protein [Burkholderia multivorans]|uniref:isochorismatase family protein n=1 Tax=Burkholderia multivorans TaxID=87883 RepID=UPI002019EB97|nr:isochorismatase family protein [Burkholderia multivorans]MCO1367040.1 isochorismatase family protein [Burkholderia multivorans]MCO1376649.1 isochorismatase family protein [Burkholderia multivorans]UQP18601.1 isochorismatase family protein [Burkholderia multivorans]UQP86570.1 isochorismatase family protein [Burkholderia multivorans]